MEHSLTDYFELEEVSETEPQKEEAIQKDEKSEDTDSSGGQEAESDNEPEPDNLISYEASSLDETDGTGLPEEPPEEVPSDNMETA